MARLTVDLASGYFWEQTQDIILNHAGVCQRVVFSQAFTRGTMVQPGLGPSSRVNSTLATTPPATAVPTDVQTHQREYHGDEARAAADGGGAGVKPATIRSRARRSACALRSCCNTSCHCSCP